MADDKLLAATLLEDEAVFDVTLRPRQLKDYIGQDKVRDNLAIFIQAARQRGETLDHVLVYGPPGLGKTTLANIIAHEMGVAIKTTSGPVIEKAGQLAGILTSLEEGDVLFIDEIHRLSPVIEEILYPAMEDYKLDIMVGQGPSARSIPVNLKKFTLIGATTRAGLINPPLRARFGIVHRLDFYDQRALTTIVRRSAKLLSIAIDAEGGVEIARRSRGTPRIANRLLKRVRDFVQVQGEKLITAPSANAGLTQLEVDEYGLDDIDRRILSTIIEKFGGGPVGIRALAQALGEDAGTIEDLHEPFLAQAGFVQRTPRGRVASPLAYRHLGLEPRAGGAQAKLW